MIFFPPANVNKLTRLKILEGQSHFLFVFLLSLSSIPPPEYHLDVVCGLPSYSK